MPSKIKDAEKIYFPEKWGAGYFSINQKGHVQVDVNADGHHRLDLYELLEKIRSAGCFEAIQFHGDESPEFCARAGFARWIKAVRVSGPDAVAGSLAFPTPHILFDGWTAEAYGGTGHRLDWGIARDCVVSHPDRRFILAGGLTAQNVRQAIRIVRPHAVDVASGVELNPRKKDEYLVREFLREAKQQRD